MVVVTRIIATETRAAELKVSLGLPSATFDKWGQYFHLGHSIGPYLVHAGHAPPFTTLGGLPHLFPVYWFCSLADGPDLAAIGLDEAACALLADVTYPDVYNGDRPMKAFVPTAIATKDADRYARLAVAADRQVPLMSVEHAIDWSADRAIEFAEADKPEPDMIERGVMGSGFTDGTLPSDGTASIERAWIPLSDGSRLMGWALCWYNR